jgi:Ca-activated chloride channel family protein
MNDLWERMDPGFLAPIWLLVGLFAVLAIVLLEVGDERRRRQALRMFAAPHLVPVLTGSASPAKRFWKKFLFLAAVAFLFVALARPHLFYEWQEEDRTGVDIFVAVDCSKSMLTQDVKPSRLERAKLAIADFADRLPDDRLGLIPFAGDAFLQVPLTLDHDAFQTAVRELDTDTIPRPGTDLATAIDLALQASRSQASNTKILLLVTDGEDLEGGVLSSAREAAKAGMKIYAIGVGTPAGGLIPEEDENGQAMYLHDSSGQIVQSKLDEATLKQIASITGGAYASLGQRGEGLDQIYDRYIAKLAKQRLESRREKIRYERYEWPLTLSILLFIASSLINERSRPVSTQATTVSPIVSTPPRRRQKAALAPAALGMLALLSVTARSSAATTEQAELDYKAGNYEEAVDKYKQAADTQPTRDELKYNLGDAAYKAGDYTQAEDAFRQALETPDLGLQEKSYYNLGNAQFRQGETTEKDDKKRTIDLWKKALTSYEDAMKLKMTPDAKYNYEYVKKKLEDLKQQQQQQQQQQQNSQSDKNKQNSSSGGQGSQQNQSNSQDQNQPQNGGNSPAQSGQNQQQNGQPNSPQPDQGGQQSGSSSQSGKNTPEQARSGSRDEDQNDPGAKSREQAEALLDSLKEDEKHMTARTLNGNNEPPPPPPSGKDW